eukprot:326441-Heterocapsa_arctica.AAC.1
MLCPPTAQSSRRRVRGHVLGPTLPPSRSAKSAARTKACSSAVSCGRHAWIIAAYLFWILTPIPAKARRKRHRRGAE